MSYSVVIPTMGRATLNKCLESVFAQTLQPMEVIIVAGAPADISEQYFSRVTIIENKSKSLHSWTAAHNRNLGMQYATGEYIAFLDDDDEWYPSKMEIQIQYLITHPVDVLLSSADYFTRDGQKSVVRPKIQFRKGLSVLDVLYSSKSWKRLRYYMPTPGIVTKRKIADSVHFNEKLLGFEDTWWLHELEMHGAVIHQTSDVLIRINASPRRSIRRATFEKDIAWARKLGTVNRKYGRNYLLGIAFRNAVVRLSLIDAGKLLRASLFHQHCI